MGDDLPRLPRTVEEQGLEDALRKGTDMDPPATEAELIERIVRRRPGQVVPLGVSFVLTVRKLGDVQITDGEKLLEPLPGKWRVVDEAVYERVMKTALTGAGTSDRAKRRRH
jgi:hypothetical protein